MLTFDLNNGEKLSVKMSGRKYITFELYSHDDKYMGKITYDSDSLADMVFCEQNKK